VYSRCTSSSYIYIGGRCSVSVLSHTHLGYWHGACHIFPVNGPGPVRSPALLCFPAHCSTFPADPCPTLSPAPGMGWALPIRPCYHPPTPRPDAMGLDPRVCVHPTVLPPKKNSHEKTYLISVVIFFCLCTDGSFCVL